MPFARRLKAAMLAAGYVGPEKLAKKLGVSTVIVRRWLKSPRPNMSATNLVSCSTVLSVRAHWLATGQGTMTRFHASEFTEEDMLKTFRQLSDREKVFFRELAGFILRFSQED